MPGSLVSKSSANSNAMFFFCPAGCETASGRPKTFNSARTRCMHIMEKHLESHEIYKVNTLCDSFFEDSSSSEDERPPKKKVDKKKAKAPEPLSEDSSSEGGDDCIEASPTSEVDVPPPKKASKKAAKVAPVSTKLTKENLEKASKLSKVNEDDLAEETSRMQVKDKKK